MIKQIAFVLAVAATSFAMAQDSKPDEVDQATRQAVDEFFKQLQELVKNGDAKGVAPLIDAERFMDVVSAGLKSFKIDNALRERVMPQMKDRLIEVFTRNPAGWDRYHVVNMESIRAGEIRVVVRNWDTSGVTYRFRLWLVKRDQLWAIYDIQDFDMGFRTTDTVSLLLDQLAESKQQQQILPALKKFQAMLLSVQEMDLEAAREPFEDLKDVKLTEFMDGIKWFVGALIASYDEDPQLVLKYLRLAKENKTETPIANYMKAVAYNMLGEPETALEHAQAYIDQFGIDPSSLLEVGIAYEQLGQTDKAIAQYRKALDDTPDSWHNLAALGTALDAADKSEITTRFARFRNKAENFEAIAEEFATAADDKALDALIAEYKKQHADDPDVKYYSALACYFREDYAVAAQTAFSAFGAVKGHEDELFFHQLYFDAMIGQEKVIEAYQAAPDRAAGFRYLCEELISVEDYDAVLQLAGARRLDASKSPYIDYFIGEAHFYREKYADADAAYSKVADLDTDDELADPVQESRIACWFYLGTAEAAYAKFKPVDQTFEQLGWLADHNFDFALLGKLLDKHEPTGKTPLTAFFRAVIAWENKKYAEVPTPLQDHLDHYFEEFAYSDARRAEEYAIRSAIRAKELQLAFQLAQRSTKRADDPFLEAIVLGSRGNAKECEALIDRCLMLGYEPSNFLEDDDLGPALSSLDANKDLKAKLEGLDKAAKKAAGDN